MGHNQDLSKYDIHTDLAIELTKEKVQTKKIDKVTISSVTLDKEQSKSISKKEGTYITIEFPDITDYDNQRKIENIFSKELKEMLKKINIKEDNTCLIIGLGNEKSTPDSIGPLAIKNIIVTNHLYLYGNLEEGFRRVFAITPGVMGETGIETSDMVKGITDIIKPDFIIVIDALAASSIERVNKTIQMTDAGINPGSGIGNKRKEISKSTLNIPVIAIGVPTVVDAASIVSDTINYMYKKFAYDKANINNPTNKLLINTNYLSKNIDIEHNDKKHLFGLVGTLTNDEVKTLIYEVLTPTGYNLMVTPKEEDFIVEKLSEVISNGINKALHKKVN